MKATLVIRKWEIRYCVCGAKMIATTSGWYCPVCRRTEYLGETNALRR